MCMFTHINPCVGVSMKVKAFKGVLLLLLVRIEAFKQISWIFFIRIYQGHGQGQRVKHYQVCTYFPQNINQLTERD